MYHFFIKSFNHWARNIFQVKKIINQVNFSRLKMIQNHTSASIYKHDCSFFSLFSFLSYLVYWRQLFYTSYVKRCTIGWKSGREWHWHIYKYIYKHLNRRRKKIITHLKHICKILKVGKLKRKSWKNVGKEEKKNLFHWWMQSMFSLFTHFASGDKFKVCPSEKKKKRR